jgi:hypothetical protein
MGDIAPILEHLHATRQRFLSTIASVPDERWLEAPRAGNWSAAEVVAHVTLIELAVNTTSNRILSAPPVSIPLHKSPASSDWDFHLALALVPSENINPSEARIDWRQSYAHCFAHCRTQIDD